MACGKHGGSCAIEGLAKGTVTRGVRGVYGFVLSSPPKAGSPLGPPVKPNGKEVPPSKTEPSLCASLCIYIYVKRDTHIHIYIYTYV